MTGYRLSVLAEIDLAEIADYTTDRWSAEQAERYLDGLVACFVRIAEMPALGRPCHTVHPGFRRIEQDSHVVFYRLDEWGIFVSRILHRRMLPASGRWMDG